MDGLRTSKTVNGVKHEYYYVGSTLQYEKFGTTELRFFYDADGNPSGVRYKNGSTTTDYYFVCNWRGDVIRIYDGAGAVVANYNYDAWGSVISVTDANGAAITDSNHIANVNPLRYRGYYYDSETGFYYVSSRYYNPEIGRWINADSILDNRGVNTLNLLAYCGNNPVNNQDPNGHFFFGAFVGGLIGGASGAITALVKGKSVTAGLLTGAATGAALGLICDVVATGGMSAVVGVALCGVAAGVGNAINQYANYKIEKKIQTQSKKTSKISRNNNSSDKKASTSSNGKLASECNNFVDYVDVKSIAISSVTAMVFAPASIGANFVVNSAFSGVGTAGATGFIAQFAVNFAMGGNISILQSIIDLF